MTNREEVAARLRDVRIPRAKDDVLWYTTLCQAVGGKKDPWYGIYALCNHLAGLIDPTCELKIQDGHACCGNCGHRLAGEYEEEEGYWCFRPYCPDCGARVVCDES